MIPVVLLHGWGMGPDHLDGLRARLAARRATHVPPLPGYAATPRCAPYTLERLAQHACASAPQRSFVVGWSLGAQVALEWARIAPAQVAGLVLVGGTPCFVQRAGWPCGMEADVFESFVRALRDDASATLRRFGALAAHGDAAQKRVTQALRAHASAVDAETLALGLDVLASADLRAALPSIEPRALVIHGERDAVVPPGAGEHLARTLPHARLHTIPGAAHAPFVSDEPAVAGRIEAFFDE